MRTLADGPLEVRVGPTSEAKEAKSAKFKVERGLLQGKESSCCSKDPDS